MLAAYIANPLVARLKALHVPRSVTIPLLLLVVMFFVTALLVTLVPITKKEVLTFGAHAPDYMNWLQGQIHQPTHGRHILDLLMLKRRVLHQWRSVGAALGQLLSAANYSRRHVLGGLARLVLVLVITVSLLWNWDQMLVTIGELIPKCHSERMIRWARDVDVALDRLLRGLLSVMWFMAFIFFLGLSLAGLDLALPIGMMTGFISFILHLGFFTGLLAARLAVLLQYDDPAHLFLVFVVWEMMESMVLGPRFVGRSLTLQPVMVIFAVLTGARLFDFAGTLLALPMSAATTVWFRCVHACYQESAWSE